MNKLAILFLKSYQIFFSPMANSLGAECRFYPSCSQYSISAFKKFLWWKAFYFSLRRILKCGWWNEGGIDKI